MGIYNAKIIVTEMIATTQLAFFSLFMLYQNDPLVHPFYILKYSNGYNYFIPFTQQN